MADQVRVKMFRYDPAVDERPRYDLFTVPIKPGMVVGEVLEYIYENLDSSIAFRYECRTRQCGSCVIQVDGEPRLFCKELIGQREEILLEPLGFLPIVRDLVSDRSPLLAPLYQVEPSHLEGLGDAKAPDYAAGPRALSVESVEWVKLTEECAECTLCTDVCPAYHSSGFAGPMLFNKLARLAYHEDDRADRRAEAWRLMIQHCKTCFRCEEICPHEIPIRQFSIGRLVGNSRSYKAYHMAGGEES